MLTVQELFGIARRVRDEQRLPSIVLGLDAGQGPRVAADGDIAPGAVLPWGSITKLVNAAAVVATGCDLDAYVHRGATLRHLLSHAGGLPAHGDPDTVEPLLPPGHVFGYSNVGVRLAAESVSADLGRVLHPLGVAVRHEPSVAEEWRCAGGLAGTVGELLTVGRALSSAAWSVLQGPRIPAGSYAGAAALGWFVDDLGGATLLRHEGRTPAGCAVLAACDGVVMAAGVPGGERGPAAWMALRALMVRLFERDPDGCRPQPDGSRLDYSGRLTTGGIDFEVDRGVLRLDGEHELLGCGADTAKVPSGTHAGARVDLLRGRSGAVIGARLDGRLAWPVS